MTREGIDPRKAKAVAMLCAGISPAQIAEEIGITTKTLERWQKEPSFINLKNEIAAEIARSTVKQTADNLSQNTKPIFDYQSRKKLILRECQHLDLALESILGRVKKGDLGAIAILIKISERRSKLLGLDQRPSNIADAIQTLCQHGIIKENQASSAFQVMDEAEIKLSQIGLE